MLNTSISCGVRRLNLRRMPFLMLSSDESISFASSNSVLCLICVILCVCWWVCVSVCLFVGTPSFLMEILEFGVYGACVE